MREIKVLARNEVDGGADAPLIGIATAEGRTALMAYVRMKKAWSGQNPPPDVYCFG